MTGYLQPYDYLVRNAEDRPDDVAIASEERQFTWKTLMLLTKRMARELRDRGVRPGDVIGVRLRPMQGNLALLAILHEAAIYMPFNPGQANEPELNVKLVIARDPIPGWPFEKTLFIDNAWFEKIHMNSAIIEQNRYPTEDSLCRIALSSGTTGRPKAMGISWLTTMVRVETSHQLTPENNQWFYTIGVRSEGGVASLLNALMYGQTHLVPSNGAQNVALIQRFNVEYLLGAPGQLADIARELETTGKTIPSVKWIVPAGNKMTAGLARRLKNLTTAVIGNAYGATEIGSVARRFTNSHNLDFMGPISPGTEVQIVDEETNQPVPDGVSGVIRVRRDRMLTEYLNSAEATALHFRDGYFYPGDRGYVTSEGLVLDGRTSELINSGGVKTDPSIVDDAYSMVAGIVDCAAFAIPDKDGIDRIALAYVSDSDLDPKDLFEAAYPVLNVRTPRSFFRVPEIPRTDMGKARRGELAELVSSNATLRTDASSPADTGDANFVQPFEHLQRAYDEAPDDPAILDIAGTVSRRALYLGAKQFGTALRDRGVLPGDIVALNVPNALDLRFTFGVLHEAAVIAPFTEAMLKPNSWNVKWLVTIELVDGFPSERQILIDREFMSELNLMPVDAAPMRYPSRDSLLRIGFSSGTTGTPKAIPFTVAQTETRALDHESRTMSKNQFFSLLIPRLGMGWWTWYASVITRRPFVIPGTPDDNVSLMHKLRVDSILASPAQLTDFIDTLRRTKISLPNLRVIQSTGSQLAPRMYDVLKELTGATIMNAYGSTEVGPTALRTDDERDPTYMGELLPGTEVEIVDEETNAPLAEGETGLIRVRRHTMVDGYFQDEAATATAWRDGWFYSGDHGRLEGSKLFIAGRREELINSGGSKIDPAMIDDHFVHYPQLKDVAAFTIVDNLGVDRPALAYVSAEPVDEHALQNKAKEALGVFTPVAFCRLDRIPRNEMGKALRAELSANFIVHVDEETEF